MIKKIISIKNVGRFKNSAPQGNPELAKHVLIVGANGYGKTTICSIFRSLQTGDCAHIIGRKTLGVSDNPLVELLLDSGRARFDGTTWTATLPNLAIFDGTFVAENVHSGEVVDINHKRNLYRIIIGQEGVHLAEEEARLSVTSRAMTTEISALDRALQQHIPAGITREQFIALPFDPDINTKIAE
ncbi:MAG: hypothetical protein OEZ32_05465 [Nitrospinota bacterium]|nr:hypothetical protein [Nitrospinota bacterium]